MIKKECKQCGGPFEASRSDAAYCSPKCRVAASAATTTGHSPTQKRRNIERRETLKWYSEQLYMIPPKDRVWYMWELLDYAVKHPVAFSRLRQCLLNKTFVYPEFQSWYDKLNISQAINMLLKESQGLNIFEVLNRNVGYQKLNYTISRFDQAGGYTNHNEDYQWMFGYGHSLVAWRVISKWGEILLENDDGNRNVGKQVALKFARGYGDECIPEPDPNYDYLGKYVA